MTEEYKDMVTLKGIQTSPEYYVITEAEYIAVLKADSAIDRVTRRYMAINERGQRSIIVTDATLKEIRAAFKEEDINELATFAYKEAFPLYPVPRIFDKNQIISIYKKLK